MGGTDKSHHYTGITQHALTPQVEYTLAASPSCDTLTVPVRYSRFPCILCILWFMFREVMMSGLDRMTFIQQALRYAAR